MPLVLVASSSRASANSRTQATLLAVLPAIGSLYQRTDCAGAGRYGHSLGFRADKMGQSGTAAFRIGKATGRRKLEPGLPTVWLPCTRQRVEWLAADAGGENGIVVGTARVDFGPRPPRIGYDPPRLTLDLYPRRSWGDPALPRFFSKSGRLKPPGP